MTPEKQKELLDRFPVLYGHPDFRRYGFCCGDGWYALILELSEKLIALEPKLQVLQLKNKFGQLRVYLEFGRDKLFNAIHPKYSDIDQVVEDIEFRSYVICEECGEPGTEDSMRVRCDKHK